MRALARFTGALALVAISLATSGSAGAEGRQIGNDAPAIRFAEEPSILVRIDGDPVYRPIAGTNLQRIVNTRPFLVRDDAGIHYLKVFDGWMETYELTGLWSVSGVAPRGVQPAFEQAVADKSVDLLDGSNRRQPDEVPTLDDGRAPAIFVATMPTELIVTDGRPRFVTIDGSSLQYAENTTADLFKEPTDDELYVLIAGRWFRAWTTDGPWESVPSRELPKDFSTIPDSCPKARVKAFIGDTGAVR
ncbi:MAG: autotransporter [Acidobacteria bacterium]|nr:autotransporter [Acidobacteriota bacterium]